VVAKREQALDHDAHRTAAKGSASMSRGGRPKNFDPKETRRRDEFVWRLLDRGATPQQVIDALRRPPQLNPHEPGYPGGLGLRPIQAKKVYESARRRRASKFQEEDRFAREEQSARLRGHIAGAAADKQYTAVASLERGYARLHGTDAPRRQAPRHGDRRALIADVLAGLDDDQLRDLAEEIDEEEPE